jgi:hypothetical protein
MAHYLGNVTVSDIDMGQLQGEEGLRWLVRQHLSHLLIRARISMFKSQIEEIMAGISGFHDVLSMALLYP